MLERRDPDAKASGAKNTRRRKATRARADAQRLRRLARRADELGELLGEDHDLAVLANTSAPAIAATASRPGVCAGARARRSSS